MCAGSTNIAPLFILQLASTTGAAIDFWIIVSLSLMIARCGGQQGSIFAHIARDKTVASRCSIWEAPLLCIHAFVCRAWLFFLDPSTLGACALLINLCGCREAHFLRALACDVLAQLLRLREFSIGACCVSYASLQASLFGFNTCGRCHGPNLCA